MRVRRAASVLTHFKEDWKWKPKKSSVFLSKAAIEAIERLRKSAVDALESSIRFEPPVRIEKIAEQTTPFLSIGNQYGEGWFLTGEMVELLRSGVNNIVCIQPFACLPNHVVGKGVIKALRKAYPDANITAIDYDPGASEVNQLNRIKLMLSAAWRNEAAEQKASGGEEYCADDYAVSIGSFV